jgi:hypothetical protein
MSNWCSSVSMYTFSKLIPAIFILPTFRPVSSHLATLSNFLRFNLADPLVRFRFVLYCGLAFAIPVYPFSLFLPVPVLPILLYCCSSIIFAFAAALAHGGAIPFPTPAGLWPGGYIPVELLNMQWGWRVVSEGGVEAAGFRWW